MKKTLLSTVREIVIETKLRTYMKDWDDNILHMPTKIKMDKKVDGDWFPVEVSTRDFAEIRNEPNYRPRNNSFSDAFRDFVESDPFIRDVKKALKDKSYAPSYEDFKETLIYGDPFAINTARGHNPETLKKGVKILIDTFSKSDKDEMKKNIIDAFKKEKRFSPSFDEKMDKLSQDQIIDLYLDEKGEYYSVSSQEFGRRMGIDVTGASANPEHAKKIAIAHFVRKIWKDMGYWINSGKSSISFGFSDDDKKNVKAAVEFLEDELSKQYPEIHFVVYDTSEGGKNKIVINKQQKETRLDKSIRKKNKSK